MSISCEVMTFFDINDNTKKLAVLEDNNVATGNFKPNENIMEGKKVEGVDVAPMKPKNGNIVEGHNNKQECTTISLMIDAQRKISNQRIRRMKNEIF